MTAVAVVLCGLFFGLGVVGAIGTWRTEPLARSSAINGSGPSLMERVGPRTPLLIGALIGGIVAAVATGWPVAGPIAALAIVGLPALFDRTASSVSIATIESIASWTEMLQATLAASAGLGQAIIATAPLSPPPIRNEAIRLAARLNAGMQPREALLQFADEIADPSVDRVVCALLLAISSRAQRLGDLLTALAESTRDEVALRLRVETSRASVRSGIRTVLVFSVSFAVALTVLAHTYLSPFGSFEGQVVLTMVGSLYASGLGSMVHLARPPAPIRLLDRLGSES